MANFYNQSTPFENGGQQQQQQQPSAPGGSAYGTQTGASGGYGSGYGAQQQQQQQAQQQGYGAYATSAGTTGGESSAYGGYGGYGGYGQGSGQQAQQQQQQQEPSSWKQQGWQSQNPPSLAPAPAASSQQGQQQQQQPQQASSIFNPAATVMAAAATGNQEAMVNAGIGVGKQFLQESTARFLPGLETTMRILRNYFAVDNRYVKAKIQRILFPFMKREWTRVQNDIPSGEPVTAISYASPINDENAFDLYIPLMALITYVLLCALCYGSAGEFNPEVLPEVAKWCFGTQAVEVLLLRGGFYAMEAPCAFLDLFSLTGYKYLGLCINMLVGLALSTLGHGYAAYYLAFFWTASAFGFFVLKTLSNNVPRRTAAKGTNRRLVVAGFPLFQLATTWFLSQTKFLS